MPPSCITSIPSRISPYRIKRALSNVCQKVSKGSNLLLSHCTIQSSLTKAHTLQPPRHLPPSHSKHTPCILQGRPICTSVRPPRIRRLTYRLMPASLTPTIPNNHVTLSFIPGLIRNFHPSAKYTRRTYAKRKKPNGVARLASCTEYLEFGLARLSQQTCGKFFQHVNGH